MSKATVIAYVVDIKEAFIRDKVTPLLKAVDGSVSGVSYDVKTNAENTDILSEIVSVWFKDGGERHINITGDSLKTAVLDILKYF